MLMKYTRDWHLWVVVAILCAILLQHIIHVQDIQIALSCASAGEGYPQCEGREKSGVAPLFEVHWEGPISLRRRPPLPMNTRRKLHKSQSVKKSTKV